ncbi:MAG: glycoside hydrolase family 5 protein [Candidatus Fimimorpha sp.]
MKKGIGIVILTICLILGNSIYITQAASVPQNAVALVEDMKLGWNLGNTLDSINAKRLHNVVGYETLWGNPVTTKKMIQMVADAGFGAVRIPVTYYDNSDADANIDKAWLERVEEIVNYVLDSGMYCIINVHHDVGKGAWITADESKYADSSYRLRKLWQQIAKHFQSYDNRLLFEGFNEILDSKYTWDNADQSAYETTNKLNQVFVDTVRDSGGNNAKRYLITNLYACVPSDVGITKFELPKDTIENHIIVGFHTYVDENQINQILDGIKTNFTDRGIAVLLSEFGMENNTPKDNTKERINYAIKIVSKAKKLGIPCFWWDNGGKFESAQKVNNYALLDRYNMKWYFSEIVKAMVDVVREDNSNISQDQSTETTTSAPSQSNDIREAESLNIVGLNKGIKTDIMLGVNSEYEMKVSIADVNSYGTMMAAKNSTTNCYQIRYEKGMLYVKYGYINSSTIKMENNKVYTIRQHERNIYIDGKLVKTSSNQNFKEGELELGQSSMRFYGMTIREKGNVIHQLVPAIDEKGMACVLDKISGKLYYSSGMIGYTELSSETNPTESSKEQGSSVHSTEVSSSDSSQVEGVREVNFLKITGLNKNIKTDIKMGMDSEYELKVSTPDVNSYGTMMTVKNSTTNCYQIRHEKDMLYVKYGYINSSTIKMENNKIYTIRQYGRNIYIDGKLVKISSNQNFKEGLLEIGQSKMNFYGMVIKEEGTVVHQLVPAVDGKGTACILDKITRKIYYSSGVIEYN